MPSETTYIYALACPNAKRVRYVGKSDDPERRYGAHLTDGRVEARYGFRKGTAIQRKTEWVAGLLSAGQRPVLVILEEVRNLPAAWRAAEHRWKKRCAGSLEVDPRELIADE